jgi:hypothetical protein
MKTAFPLLVATSLVFNVVLAGLLVVGRQTPPSGSAQGDAKRAAHTLESASKSGKIDPTIWPAMQTDEMAMLVNRLGMAGFPQKMIRAIVSARIDDFYRNRFTALSAEEGTVPFWMMPLRGDSKQDLARQQLYRAKENLLTDLLGEDPDERGVPEPMTRILQGRLIASVPPEKLDRVRQLLHEFDAERSKLEAVLVSPNDEKKITALEQARRAALSQILSPAEFLEYELRMSKSADSLRFELAEFAATEAEFRLIFPLWQSFEEHFDERLFFRKDTPEEKHTLAEARSQMNEQVRAALGPPRGEDYERTTDLNYHQTSRLVERLQLPAETASQLWSVRKEIQQRAQGISRNATLSPDEQGRQISALTEEAKSKITGALGERGFEAYRRYGGEWLQDLLSPTAKSP